MDNYFEDYCLTFTEAKNIQNNIDQLIKESEDILRIARLPAYNLTQDSDVYDFSAKEFKYKLKLDELNNVFNALIQGLSFPITIEEQARNGIFDLFKEVQNEKSKLINKIAEKRADEARTEAEDFARLIGEGLQNQIDV